MSGLALARLAAQVLCIGWAASVPTPRVVHRYLMAQFMASVIGEAVLAKVEDITNELYAIVFIALSLVVYATMLGIMREAIRKHPARLLAVCVGAAVAMLTVSSVVLNRNLGLFDWMATIDAAVLIFMAVCSGLGAAHHTPQWQRISLTLMAFWLAQAVFELGLTMHLWNSYWMRTNEWLPAILVCSGCAWLARISRLKGRKAEA
jgi:hypothetical protein